MTNRSQNVTDCSENDLWMNTIQWPTEVKQCYRLQQERPLAKCNPMTNRSQAGLYNSAKMTSFKQIPPANSPEGWTHDKVKDSSDEPMMTSWVQPRAPQTRHADCYDPDHTTWRLSVPALHSELGLQSPALSSQFRHTQTHALQTKMHRCVEKIIHFCCETKL